MTFKSLMLAVVAGAFGADLALLPVPDPQVWGMLLAGLGIWLGTLKLHFTFNG